MAFRTNKTPVLQEKTASGAVASFNTALAMPLASCKIAVNAWQEGSGDPSPDNVRPIHGFSMVNATRAGKNLLDKSLLVKSTSSAQPFLGKWGVDNFATTIPNGSIFLSAGQYTLSRKNRSGEILTNTQLSIYDENGDNLYTRYTVTSITFTVPKSMAVCVYINCGASRFTSWDDYDIQLEAGSTATAYEPYVTPTIYTITLGQEVYGAEVDVVNGVAHVTHKRSDDISNISWRTLTSSEWNCFYITSLDKKAGGTNILCEVARTINFYNVPSIDNAVMGNGVNNTIYFRDTSFNLDVNAFKQAYAGYYLYYELDTPFDIQLTPTQIETLIGDNTIFADTGDVDLTYNDLDIAKRGSFREVFKLP